MQKTPVAALIAAWLGVVFLAGTCMIMGIAIIFEKDLLLSASCLFIPLTVGIYSLNYIIQQRKIKAISEFIFCDKEFSRFQIPYMAQDRSKACAFARKIANFCNHSLYEKNECPCITHQFSNGLAELRDTRVVVFNKDGIKCGDCDYISVVPGLHHHRESHIIRNFFCILAALLFWFGTLVFFIGTAITLKDWSMAFGHSIMYAIPFLLGCFFFSKRKKSQNYYFSGCRAEESGNIGIYLEVGKNPDSEQEFIEELNRRLRKAHNEYKYNCVLLKTTKIKKPL